MRKSCDLDLGQFKVIQGAIDSLGVILCSTSIDPIVVHSPISRYLTLQPFFIGTMVKINFNSGLADMRVLDFHHNKR